MRCRCATCRLGDMPVRRLGASGRVGGDEALGRHGARDVALAQASRGASAQQLRPKRHRRARRAAAANTSRRDGRQRANRRDSASRCGTAGVHRPADAHRRGLPHRRLVTAVQLAGPALPLHLLPWPGVRLAARAGSRQGWERRAARDRRTPPAGGPQASPLPALGLFPPERSCTLHAFLGFWGCHGSWIRARQCVCACVRCSEPALSFWHGFLGQAWRSAWPRPPRGRHRCRAA